MDLIIEGGLGLKLLEKDKPCNLAAKRLPSIVHEDHQDKNERDRVGWNRRETAFTVHLTELTGHDLNLAIRPVEFVFQILAESEFTPEPED